MSHAVFNTRLLPHSLPRAQHPSLSPGLPGNQADADWLAVGWWHASVPLGSILTILPASPTRFPLSSEGNSKPYWAPTGLGTVAVHR